MSVLRAQVRAFREVSGSPERLFPRIPEDLRVRLAAKLIAEEFFETMEALFPRNFTLRSSRARVAEAIENSSIEVDMVELADGLGDIDYTVEWARQEFGINGGAIADEIQRSNMAKFAGGVRHDANGKVMKPEGWTPPDIARELKWQGWNG